ncbi:hypothetical protein JCM9279_000542 [Rhodotorula babjevae]
MLLPLDLDRVVHELDEILVDSILPGHGAQLHESLQALVVEVKRDLATPNVWRMLEAFDPRSGPAPQTFQWSVYLAVRHLRSDLMHGWIGSPQDVESTCAKIRGIIATGSRTRAQFAAEHAERQRFDLREGLRRSHQVDNPVPQPMHSLGRQVLATQLISKRSAARYGVSQRDLARRWT